MSASISHKQDIDSEPDRNHSEVDKRRDQATKGGITKINHRPNAKGNLRRVGILVLSPAR
jgi:hypothetical protein